MKAVWHKRYGSEEVLSINEIPKPIPKPGELLVRIKAATVNRSDCGLITGLPKIVRLNTGFPEPKKKVTGTDFAGIVEEIGPGISSNFKKGDRVWGFDDSGLCSHAEYLVTDESAKIKLIPDGFSDREVIASIEGLHYARNFINKTSVGSGDKVLVNGATGAIGSAMVQLLKYMDSEVTATANTKNIGLVKRIGADRVIDWEKSDFTQDTEKYDYVFDAVGKSTFGRCKPLLKETGTYISSELGPGGENLYLPILTMMKKGKKVKFPFPSDIPKSMDLLLEMLRKGALQPVIDRTYPLDDALLAFQYVFSGEKTGSVILEMQ